MYTNEEIIKLARLVAFTDTPLLVEAFAEQDEELSSQVTAFHLEVVILQTIRGLVEIMKKASYADLRDELMAGPFYGVPISEIEMKLDKFIKGLTTKKLLTDKMELTDASVSFLELTNRVFFSIQDSTTISPENPH